MKEVIILLLKIKIIFIFLFLLLPNIANGLVTVKVSDLTEKTASSASEVLLIDDNRKITSANLWKSGSSVYNVILTNDLFSAVTDNPGSDKTLMVYESQTLSGTSLSVPHAFQGVNGAIISGDAITGTTLNFHGPFEAGDYQVFSTDSSVTPLFPAGTVVNARWWGAGSGTTYVVAGTGEADEMQMAINSLPDGGTVYFPPGYYPIEKVYLVPTSNLTLAGAGRDNTILYSNNTVDTGNAVFFSRYAIPTSVASTFDSGTTEIAGTQLCDMTDGSVFEVGKWYQITSDQPSPHAGANAELGEYVFCSYISGNSVEFAGGLKHSYDTAVYTVTFRDVEDGLHNVTIKDMSIHVPDGRVGKCIELAGAWITLKDLDLQVVGLKTGYASIWRMVNVKIAGLDVEILNCKMTNRHQTGANLGYGHCLDTGDDTGPTDNLLVDGCDLTAYNQTVDISGGYVNNDSKVVNSIIRGAEIATVAGDAGNGAYTQHPAAFRGSLNNCVIYGPLEIRGTKWSITNNDIHGYVTVVEDPIGKHIADGTFSGNRVKAVIASPYVAAYSFFIGNATADLTKLCLLTITDNQFDFFGTAKGIAVYSGTGTPYSLIFANNIVNGSTTPTYGLCHIGGPGKKLLIENNILINHGIRIAVSAPDSLEIIGNYISNNNKAIDWSNTNTELIAKISNNDLISTTATTNAIHFDDTATLAFTEIDLSILGNKIYGSIDGISGLTEQAFKGITINDNKVYNNGGAAIYLSGATDTTIEDIAISDNSFDASVYVISGASSFVFNGNSVSGATYISSLVTIRGQVGYTTDRLTFYGNTIDHTEGNGLTLNYVNLGAVTGNIIKGTADVGINLDNYGVFTITGNIINGETTVISDDASGVTEAVGNYPNLP